MAEGPGPLKKKLLGWLKDALEGTEPAQGAEKAEAPAPKGSSGLKLPGQGGTGSLGRPGSGPLPGAPGGTGELKRGSGPLQPGSDQFTRSGTGALPERRAPNTGQLRPGSGPVGPGSTPLRAASGPIVPPPPPEMSLEEQEEESEKRMAFIVDYLDDPDSDEMFQDKQLVYKILSEERTYQQHRIVRLTADLRRLGPVYLDPDEDDEQAVAEEAARTERREEIEEEIAGAKRRAEQLFRLLKQLTGVKGRTGGTGFLAPATPPPLPPIGES